MSEIVPKSVREALLNHIGALPGTAVVLRRPTPEGETIEVRVAPGASLQNRPDAYEGYTVVYTRLTPGTACVA